MKIAIGFNKIEGPWGGGNQFADALELFLRKRGVNVVRALTDDDIDVILLTDPRKEMRSCAFSDADIADYISRVNVSPIVVHRINECDERKGTIGLNDRLMEANRVAHHTVYVASWLRDLFESKRSESKPHSVILNGSDRKIFNPEGGACWDGSSPLKIVTHHWGASWLKGFDIYEQLDARLGDPVFRKQYEFTYIGNVPDGFAFKNARHIAPLHGPNLSAEIKKHHIYLTASRHEPGGNHQNEGGNCGLPILYINSGCMPEYCEGYGIMYDPSDFFDRLEEIRTQYQLLRARALRYPHTSEKTGSEYFNLFKRLVLARAGNRGRDDIAGLPARLKTSVDVFLASVRQNDGSISPTASGVNISGLNLGFQCFAAKTLQTVGLIEGSSEKSGIAGKILSYRAQPPVSFHPLYRFAFIDAARPGSVWLLLKGLARKYPKTSSEQILIAETKQAIATLHGLGDVAFPYYRGCADSAEALTEYFNLLDWRYPWAAGGQFSAQMVFASLLPNNQLQLKKLSSLIDSLVDPVTGGYFRGGEPEHGQLVNGAMKVLSGMDWCEIPVHYPERLIDTVLTRQPASEGCHLVDAVYVLYRCLQFTDHRKKEVQAYCSSMVQTIMEHYHPDEGGFSYYRGRSQQTYYGITITDGENCADIHGTVLLTWALSMIFRILDVDASGWQVFKP